MAWEESPYNWQSVYAVPVGIDVMQLWDVDIDSDNHVD
jgi:hypothetical protein